MTDYASVAQLKTYVGIATTITGDDGLLQECLDRARATIDNDTNRTFAADTDSTRYFDAPLSYFDNPQTQHDIKRFQDDFYKLMFDTDICSITSVTNGDGTTVTSSQYITMPRNYTPYYGIQLRWNSGIAWTWTTDPLGAITVVGKWGYSTTPPADIVQACIRLAAWYYRQKDTSKDNTADRPIMSASGAVLMPSAMPHDYRQLIAPYIRRINRSE